MDEIALLVSLLHSYSPTGNESRAVNGLVAAMRQAGFSARIDRTGNAVGTLGEGPRELVLLGHIDTVPGEILVRREGDHLYGRGAVDAKGPLACFTAAAARLGPQPGWRVTVIGAVGEEGDSRGARGILDEYRPEAAIIGEPSGWDHITLGYKGSAWFDYRLTKPMVHTAARTESACEAAVAFWNRVDNFSAQTNLGQERSFFQLTPGLRRMSSSSDGFSETALLQINFRLPPGLESAQLSEQLASLAGEGRLEMTDSIPAYRGEKNTPLVRAFLAGIRAAGGAPAFALKTGTADINLVAPAWGCPALAYGPGDSALDHTPNEHILIPEYLRSIQVLTGVLETLTSPPPNPPEKPAA
jgi:LysW-gamma-L-lysine carboxypeptidase